MFGMTKRGKTTLGHYFVGEPLEGVNNKGAFYYKAKYSKDVYKKATIGHTANSETLIPNFFYPSSSIIGKIQKLVIIDSPGFQNTYGCLRTILSAFSNYRVFSKVRKMKFVLIVQKSDMEGDISGLIKTFKAFFDNFKDIEKYPEDIINAASFVITKHTGTVEDSVSRIEAILAELQP